ncbi:MAG: S8 family serine peptidase [Armatimonadota bacterium]|nr:S8 family serine peptidase [Armatimonadota bacterium]
MANHYPLRRTVLLTAALIGLLAGLAKAAHKPDEILIKYKPGHRARVMSVAGALGAKCVRSLDQIRYHVLKLPSSASLPEAIQAIKQNPSVEYAGPNHIVSICKTPNDDWYQFMGIYLQWGLYDPDNPNVGIDAERAWDLTTGSPDLVIGIVDTGVMTDHEDLWAKIVPGRNLITGADPSDVYDDHGHGTFVAGVAAAITNNVFGIAGVTWGSKIMPIKVLDANGYGTEADAAAGIVWAADNGAKIINMSFGGYDDVPAEHDAIRYAASKGCVLVAASGNDDSEEPFFPAAYEEVIAVGASNEYGQRCTAYDWGEGGSNYGSYLDVVAPGNFILGTWNDGSYNFSSGTSAAAPFVSGIAALVWSYYPHWTNNQVAEQIKSTCTDIPPAGWDYYTGWGIANAYRALTSAPIRTIALSELSQIPDGTRVRIGNLVATSNTGEIPGRVYVEQPDRARGIALLFSGNPPNLREGDRLEVTGMVETISGERVISGPTIVNVGSTSPVKPLALAQKWIGGSANQYMPGITNGLGANNVGLLVTVCGRVVSTSAFDYFYVDDGSNRDDGTGLIGLKVNCRNLMKPPRNSFVTVTGISSVEQPFGPDYTLPVLRVRRQTDIQIINQ